MGIYVVLSILAVLILLILIGELVSSVCPECRRVGIRYVKTKVVDKEPVVLSVDADGNALLRGQKIIRETTYRCKHCNHEIVKKEEHVF